MSRKKPLPIWTPPPDPDGEGKGAGEGHPRDRYITVFGRKPVLEALLDGAVAVDKVVLASGLRGEVIKDIESAARARGIPVRWASAVAVTRLSRNGRQDQGVVADIRAPRMKTLEQALGDAGARATWLLLDGMTTPANVGMVIRGATAAGVDAVVLPRAGCPEMGPLVVKASAGVALHAPMVRCGTSAEAAEALRHAGFTLVGLRAQDADDLFSATLPARVALVLGNESTGISPGVLGCIGRFVRIPMAGGVESLNAALAGVVVAYELYRRRLLTPPASSGAGPW